MKKNSKLKVMLFERDITLRELAEQTGVPRTYISLSINGRFNLEPQQERKIAEALGVSLRDVFQ